MDHWNASLAIVGLLVLLLGLTSDAIRRRIIVSEAIIALLCGFCLGPSGLGWLRAPGIERIPFFHQFSQLTLAVALVGVALRVPPTYLAQHRRAIAIAVLVLMPLMWIVASALSWALLDYGPLGALLFGAIVTPTDPVVAGAIVSGQFAEERIPAPLRHVLSTESGANDGLAYALLMVPTLLLERSPRAAAVALLCRVLLWEVLAAAAMGLALGWLVGKLVQHTHERGWSGEVAVMTVGIALAITALATARLMNSDGLLAAFAAGVAFDYVIERDRIGSHLQIQEAAARLLVLPIFILLGALAPYDRWLELGAGPWLCVALVLLLKRMPAVALLRRWLAPLRRPRETLFFGWFGPIGIAALYYATLTAERTGDDTFWVLGSLAVCASIIVHGATATWAIARFSTEPAPDAPPDNAPRGGQRPGEAPAATFGAPP